jgi:hypothetical protein
MKLGKEEIQKLGLGLLMLIGLIYCYVTLLLGPLRVRRENDRKSIAALTPQIEGAKEQIKRADAIAQSEAAARATVAQVDVMIPEGSPVAWFPPRVAEFFKARAIDKASTRLNNESAEKEMPGFRRLSWGIDLPKVDFISFAAALSQLENEEPLMEVLSLQIDTNREDNESQRALLTVNNIVKQ